MFDWLRRLKKRISKRAAPPKIVGYYNGLCPICGTHIGTDITKGLTGKLSAKCGACNREIYDQLDKAAVVTG